MKELLWSRITLVWFGLIAATLMSWEVGHGMGFTDARLAGAAIILVAFLKVRYVILDFMEIRHAPLIMRVGAETWVVVMSTVSVVLFLNTTPLAQP